MVRRTQINVDVAPGIIDTTYSEVFTYRPVIIGTSGTQSIIINAVLILVSFGNADVYHCSITEMVVCSDVLY